MMNLFGPQRPIDESSHVWRILVAAASIMVGSVMLIFLFTSDVPRHLQEMSVVANTLFPEAEDVQAGDALIEPPHAVPPPRPALVGDLPDPALFSAQSIFVKDQETGTVLFHKNEYDPRPIASITKLMSALLILEREPQWGETASVISDDIIDTHMYAGDTYTLEELWNAALIGSSNKAIYTLADALSWPREAFVERMNQKARELGLAESHFVDPTGLEAGNISTASDVAILFAEAIRHEPIRQSLSAREYMLFSKERQKKHHMWNTNWLLLGWIPHAFAELYGGKTGYIPDSGYNFVVRVGNENGHAIDVVILGAESHEARFTEARDVAAAVFAGYQWP